MAVRDVAGAGSSVGRRHQCTATVVLERDLAARGGRWQRRAQAVGGPRPSTGADEMMRGAVLCACLTIAAAASVSAQAPPAGQSSLERLIVDARHAPPEFEADALLRIAVSRALTDRRRLEIMNEAFQRAYGAQGSYRRITYGVPTDSRQGAQAQTYDSRLTRVSLQVRSTQMMA